MSSTFRQPDDQRVPHAHGGGSSARRESPVPHPDMEGVYRRMLSAMEMGDASAALASHHHPHYRAPSRPKPTGAATATPSDGPATARSSTNVSREAVDVSGPPSRSSRGAQGEDEPPIATDGGSRQHPVLSHPRENPWERGSSSPVNAWSALASSSTGLHRNAEPLHERCAAHMQDDDDDDDGTRSYYGMYGNYGLCRHVVRTVFQYRYDEELDTFPLEANSCANSGDNVAHHDDASAACMKHSRDGEDKSGGAACSDRHNNSGDSTLGGGLSIPLLLLSPEKLSRRRKLPITRVLPNEIFVSIFVYLDMAELVNVMCVSKDFFSHCFAMGAFDLWIALAETQLLTRRQQDDPTALASSPSSSSPSPSRDHDDAAVGSDDNTDDQLPPCNVDRPSSAATSTSGGATPGHVDRPLSGDGHDHSGTPTAAAAQCGLVENRETGRRHDHAAATGEGPHHRGAATACCSYEALRQRYTTAQERIARADILLSDIDSRRASLEAQRQVIENLSEKKSEAEQSALQVRVWVGTAVAAAFFGPMAYSFSLRVSDFIVGSITASMGLVCGTTWPSWSVIFGAALLNIVFPILYLRNMSTEPDERVTTLKSVVVTIRRVVLGSLFVYFVGGGCLCLLISQLMCPPTKLFTSLFLTVMLWVPYWSVLLPTVTFLVTIRLMLCNSATCAMIVLCGFMAGGRVTAHVWSSRVSSRIEAQMTAQLQPIDEELLSLEKRATCLWSRRRRFETSLMT